MAIGVAGSFVAFYIGKLLGWTSGHPDSLLPVGFIQSMIGAVILLLVYHLIRRRRTRKVGDWCVGQCSQLATEAWQDSRKSPDSETKARICNS